jgi:formylglycine-generating enzyme required for sulfatase activity
MGSAYREEGADDDEQPRHKIQVSEFWMGKFQVTQAQWGKIAKLPKVNQDLNSNPSHFKGKNLPVEQVSWIDAIEACDRLSKKTGKTYRLPSEAEWEYACRAGTKTSFYFGETISTDLANYCGQDRTIDGKTYPGKYGKGQHGSFRETTIDVGSFPSNAFGLFDMHGNVWEWCADLWHENYKKAPTDGSAWDARSNDESALRVLRGGSWYDNPRSCRSACRGGFLANVRCWDDGFRLVCPHASSPIISPM